MVRNVLRDHYEGTAYDLTQGMAAGPFGTPNRMQGDGGAKTGLWERAISMHRTSYSFVCEARPDGQAITWFGLDAPHGSAYLPFLAAATEGAPTSFKSHSGYMSKFDTGVAWWAFNLVNQYTDLNFRLINADVRTRAASIEDDATTEVEKWMQEFSLGKSDSLAALTERSNAFAQKAVDEWWTLAFSLFAKYGRGSITVDETDKGAKSQPPFPEWWLTSPDVGFTSWTRAGPFHGTPANVTAERFQSRVDDLEMQLAAAQQDAPNGALTMALVSDAFLALVVLVLSTLLCCRRQARAVPIEMGVSMINPV